MNTLVDQFEMNSPLTSSGHRAPAAPRDLPEVPIDWEETFHGGHHDDTPPWRGSRVWSSED